MYELCCTDKPNMISIESFETSYKEQGPSGGYYTEKRYTPVQ